MKRFTLDLSKADGYAVTEDDVIRSVFIKNGVFNNNFLFSVVDGNLINRLITKGTYRVGNKIYAFKKDGLVIHNKAGDFDLDDAMRQYENPAIAIYKASHFISTDIPFEYQFKDSSNKPKALEAIVNITW